MVGRPAGPRTPSMGVMQQARTEVSSELDDLVAGVAAELGPAEGSAILSPEAEARHWGQSDPRVDYDALKGMLLRGAVPPEWYDPTSDQRLAVVRASPQLAPLFSRPLDDEMASMVAQLAEHPFRHALLAPYKDDPAAMVERANRINGRATRARPPASERLPSTASTAPATTDPEGEGY